MIRCSGNKGRNLNRTVFAMLFPEHRRNVGVTYFRDSPCEAETGLYCSL